MSPQLSDDEIKLVRGSWWVAIDGATAHYVTALLDEAEASRKKLAAILEIHRPSGKEGRIECGECGGTGCFEWPCDTRTILSGVWP